MTNANTDADSNDEHKHHVPHPTDEGIEYPTELRITTYSGERAQKAILDRVDQWEAGEEVPHTINFQDPSELHKLFTERRLDLLRSVMTDPPDSIRALADRLDRGVSEVHDDVYVLNDLGILYFEDGPGRRKRPRVPYERIHVEIELESDSENNASTDPVSA